jgi:hypothetical protein
MAVLSTEETPEFPSPNSAKTRSTLARQMTPLSRVFDKAKLDRVEQFERKSAYLDEL